MNFSPLQFLLVGGLLISAMADIITELDSIRIRRWWTKPHLMERARNECGAYTTVFTYFKLNDHEEFQHFTGMSVLQFSYILDNVRNDLTTTSHRPGLHSELKLAATINYLRFGDNIRVADDFYGLYGYPHCLGALDGRHFRIRKPAHSGGLYFNRKKYHSIVLLTACDAHRRFIYASVGHRGGRNDAGIFNTCQLAQDLENGRIQLPRPARLPNSDVMSLFNFIADGGFGLQPYMMIPYRDHPNKTIEEKIFDIRLTNARKIVECAFGVLVERFQVFDTPLRFKPKTSQNIILCCMVIHNYLTTCNLDYEKEQPHHQQEDSDLEPSDVDDDADVCPDASFGEQFQQVDDMVDESGSSEQSQNSDNEMGNGIRNMHSADDIRENLKIYFVTDGDVNWQWAKLQ
ncbi:hypothetical protein QAD02_007776 [Eretmocerus hayati]|uniref:Uncharacterized protein n=1 Tax=Eretmocerus hayati TaxID=131215 RepID=A0ACC2N4I4_9HYME|nr:hypothetical protein QAD02_007776 [Eretmocerus hayati]